MIKSKLRVCVVTGTRADYGIYVPLLKELKNNPNFELGVLVTGMHLSQNYGNTWKEILVDGYPIIEKVDILLQGSSHANMSKSVGLGILGMTSTFERYKPDLIFVLGDRGEMLSAAISASHLNIPVAHLHGGEVSGSIDESVRHAITKLSHIHFPSTKASADRIIKLGEREEYVFPVGALRIDTILNAQLPNFKEIKEKYQLSLKQDYYLMVFHPVTTDLVPLSEQVENVLQALLEKGRDIICILPNSDAGTEEITRVYSQYEKEERITYIKNFHQLDYLSVLDNCFAIVGNSSSGILEAASFQKAVVNIGSRQTGREHSTNVLDVPPNKDEIKTTLDMIEQEEFKASLKEIKNIYGDGNATSRIISILGEMNFDNELIGKKITY
ncbi:UDP-N-acetylglucosamine 2-epimerase [Metabacillus sp. HB246100]